MASLRLNWKFAVAALVLLGGVLFAADLVAQRALLRTRLLSVYPDQAAVDPQLVSYASARARPLYAQYCASCHGDRLQGNPALGAPNLADSVWLYGTGSVYDIERTVMYGARSGRSKGHAITDMPAFGLIGKLSDGEIRNVVQYVLQLSGNPYDPAAANAGKDIFFGKAACSDCHGSDARGDSGYGSPDLTRNVWNSGGDAESLYRAVYFGQHHVMPDWLGTLSLEDIRALAVYVHSISNQSPQ